MEWNIGYITKKRASFSPHKKALIYEDVPVTYKELNDAVNRTAHFLKDKGLKKGDRISVVLLKLNIRLAGPELEYQLNHCGARLLVFHDAFLGNIEPIRNKIKVEDDKVIFLKSNIPDCPTCPRWAVDYDGIMIKYPVEELESAKPVELDDPLAILYTSGVTGVPKGAVVSHKQTYFKIFQIMMYADLGFEDIYLAQLPLFHSGGLFIVATPVLCRGATLVLRRGFDPERFARDIEKYSATVVNAMTTMWRFIIQTGVLNEIDTSSLRVVFGGGERTPIGMIEELAEKGLYLQLGFGQTENSMMMLLPKEDIMRKKGSVGLPGFFTEIWIEDDQGKQLPPGKVGEIVARGPTVMSGYWNMPEKTAETIVNGVLRTGDLGYVDEEGYFFFVDRIKDMYRSGGENVFPAEVEKTLSNHPKILNAAVIGVPDERWGETGKAFIMAKEGETITPDEIYDFLEGKIGRYKFPTQIELVDALPMTASGKIKKVELKGKYGLR
jgi:fatty-acyl-CoA synthase